MLIKQLVYVALVNNPTLALSLKGEMEIMNKEVAVLVESKVNEIKFLDTFNGYNVYTNEKVTFAACSPSKKIIYVNEDVFYTHTTPEERKAVILHEIGHLVHGHSGKQRSLEDELQADKYAVDRGYSKQLYSCLIGLVNVGLLELNEETKARLRNLTK